MNFTTLWQSAGLLIVSNAFMTFAWYAHLRNWNDRKWYVAAVLSWGIALFEYLLQVPANRIGHGTLNLAQLKIMQEVITLTVFVPFAMFYMNEPFKRDFLWAALCLVGGTDAEWLPVLADCRAVHGSVAVLHVHGRDLEWG